MLVEAKTAYIDVNHVAKHAAWLAKSEVKKEKFATVSPDDGVLRIAKQMECRNKDIVGENWVYNDTGELALTDENKMKAWVDHYVRLLNVEFVWPSKELHEDPPFQLLAPSQCVHDPDPQSTQQNEM